MTETPAGSTDKISKKLIKINREDTLKALSSAVTVDKLRKYVESGKISICLAANQNTMDVFSGKDVPIKDSLINCPLSAIDKIAEGFYDLNDLDTQTEDKLSQILEEINGLRHDLAEIFSELKIGNIAATSSAQFDRRSREQIAARVARLEERDQKVAQTQDK